MSTATAPARQSAPANGNGQAAPPARPPRFIARLESAMPKIMAALPKHLTAERLIQVVSIIHYRTPRLQECDPDSILSSVVQGAALGLDFSPSLGEAYLVPVYNKDIRGLECQFRPGYQGLIKLARQTGQVEFIQARLVHDGDPFFYRYTPWLEFLHEPSRKLKRGPVTDVYAVAKLASGDPLIEVMTVDEIELIHQKSESYKWAQREQKPEWGPWVTDLDEMRKKTVIRRLSKVLPKSPDLVKALEADDRDYDFSDQRPTQVAVPSQPGRGVAGLRQNLGLEHQPAMPPPIPDAAETRETAPVEQQSPPWKEPEQQQEPPKQAPQQSAPKAPATGSGESWLDWSTQTIKQTNDAWAEEQKREDVEPSERKALLNSFELIGILVNGVIAMQPSDELRAEARAKVGKDDDPTKRDQKKAGRFAADFFAQNPMLAKQIIFTRIRQKRCELRAQLGMAEDPDDFPGSDSDDASDGGQA